jgi:protein-S-isoprenylcysteine O-methyltransferase Ste14
MKKGILFVIPQFLLILLIAFTPKNPHSQSIGKILGSILFFLGAAVLCFAWIALKPSITAFPEPKPEAPFITTGIYKYVRHPMYLGLLCVAAGVTYIRWSRSAAIETLLLFILLRFKMRYEDRLLRMKWPAATDYQEQTGALLPKSKR